MALFEGMVLLLFVAAFLLAISRRLSLPYPALLCVAGVAVALRPGGSSVVIDPHMALALFIAPALLDASYATSPRELKRAWAPLVMLAVGAVLATTAAVAFVGVHVAGLPLLAAVALGAIVSPPDAAATNAVLSDIGLPRHGSLVLQGEGLLNDAAALLIFSAATAAISPAVENGGTIGLLFAVPGGILFGMIAGWLYGRIICFFEATLSAVIVQFTTTFGVWLLAERFHLSPVLAVAAYGMTIARIIPERESARDRVQTRAVWAAVVFVLNVVAFLFMGLAAHDILGSMPRGELADAGWFALLVLGVVVATRFLCVFGYRALSGALFARLHEPDWLMKPPPWRLTTVVSWCGMRGLLTLATAFALPHDFPGRNVIVLTGFTVVLGTLVIQGATLKPLIRLMRIEPDGSIDEELAGARRRVLTAGLEALDGEDADVARLLRLKLGAAKAVARSGDDPQGPTRFDDGMARVVEEQRRVLHAMRARGEVDDDVFHRIEEELDWTELAARPNRELEIGEA